MAIETVRIGLVGFGTVGTGVARLIVEHGDLIAAKTGIRLELGCIVDADITRPRPVAVRPDLLTTDLDRLLNDRQISIGVELVGGIEQARQIQIRML
ncbi:MAG: hypothetical protein QHH07_03585, partial [Sedimentisphaerales bacterium]|nr:hypothetical protein [Sedimentisphaerales bacterium]